MVRTRPAVGGAAQRPIQQWIWQTCWVLWFCIALTACSSQLPQTDVAPATATLPALPTRVSEEGREESGDGYVHITPVQLALMLEHKDFLLINTHAPYGFEIARTDAHIPLDDEGQWLRHYPADRAAKIVLYCRSGRWSTVAALELVAAGYTNLYHLDGGMVAWYGEGFPLQDN